MLLGAAMEGGSIEGPWPVGDNGTSFGPFQIHNALPRNQAENPATAVSYMLQRYRDGVAAETGWNTNPVAAAANAARRAELPAEMYSNSQIQGALPKALTAIGENAPDGLSGSGRASQMQQAASMCSAHGGVRTSTTDNSGWHVICNDGAEPLPPIGNVISALFPGAAGAVNTATGAANTANAAGAFLAKLSDPAFVLRGVLVVSGVLLLLVGVVVLATRGEASVASKLT